MDRAISKLVIKAIDEEQRTIEGMATTPTPDRVGDIVEPKGAQFSLPLPLLLRHNSDEPVGEVISAKASSDGIPFKARLKRPTADMPDALVNRLNLAWAEVKAGLIRGVSIGFRSMETSFIEATGGLRFIAWEWLELSLVTIPANVDATIQTIKSIDASSRAALGESGKGSANLDQLRPGATG